ncbi:MAG: hypothetical protein NDP13_00550 [Crenarchaeota archaeon]|nr:hypothetical protein [Thermoproteota archaeon]MCR8453474.1 hypothetical protein [Thermoproteota archaeon]MCR8462767.1 hypothetical protein [Thermoproteota archaeon]MCR8470538.1 hypothetical protein [Thermoproteota archaeon]MCR8471533.1 hypothetical protein [Thermoproteota archaeon]
MQDAEKAVDYFIKILRLELGVEIKETEQPTSTISPTIAAEIQTRVTGPPNTLPAAGSQIATAEGLAQQTGYQEIITRMNEALQNLRASIMSRIEALERRISNLEKVLQTKSIEQPLIESRTNTDILSKSITTSISVDQIDLLVHEAREELARKETSLEQLIKIEAIEWQLIKALENNERASEKIPKDLLSALRFEIARLRKSLLE